MYRVISVVILLFQIFQLNAQKFGHFSSQYIVQQMPSYGDAQDELNKLSQSWMEEVRNMYLAIGKLENKLEAEKVLLTKEMLRKREDEIAVKLKEAIDYQYRIFGPEGLLFLKKKELVKPELDKIFEAVERVCKKHRLDYLLDKSGELVMIYTNPVHDYTDFVLEELGLGNPDDVIR